MIRALFKGSPRFFGLLLGLAILPVPNTLAAGVEQSFDVLQIGTATYTNVTVTKSKDYVFLFHSRGMLNVKISDLSRENLQKLGYMVPDPVRGPDDVVVTNSPDAATLASSPQQFDPHNPAPWAKQRLATSRWLQSPQVKRLLESLSQRVGSSSKSAPADPQTSYIMLGVILLGYLIFSYCCSLICRNAGRPGGLLVWLPGLHWFPLFRAAGMSGAWVLALLVPVLNVVAIIIWSVEIAKACGKNAFVGLLLLVPGVNVIPFLYLAFSGNKPSQPSPSARKELMTLETA